MADLGGMWLFGRKVRVPECVACSVCDAKRRCSCSCRLWRYISVMPLPSTFISSLSIQMYWQLTDQAHYM